MIRNSDKTKLEQVRWHHQLVTCFASLIFDTFKDIYGVKLKYFPLKICLHAMSVQFLRSYRSFSPDVTAALLVYKRMKTAAMLVYRKHAVGNEQKCICSNKFS